MDYSLLKQQGYNPSQPAQCFAEDYKLHIGERASLVKSQASKSYGTIMSLTQEELSRLYSSDSVKDYLPETITVTCADGNTILARVYLLPESKLSGVNSNYAIALVKVAQKVGLPASYIKQIESFID